MVRVRRVGLDKLSQLTIDAAKDWEGFDISHLGKIDPTAIGTFDLVQAVPYVISTGGVDDQLVEDNEYNLCNEAYLRVGQKKTLTRLYLVKFGVKMYKHGSPTGRVYFRVRDATTDDIVIEKDLMDASELPASGTWCAWTNPTPLAVLLNGTYRLGVEFAGGDANNYVSVGVTLADVKAGECLSDYPSPTGPWQDAPACDMSYHLTTYGISCLAHYS